MSSDAMLVLNYGLSLEGVPAVLVSWRYSFARFFSLSLKLFERERRRQSMSLRVRPCSSKHSGW